MALQDFYFVALTAGVALYILNSQDVLIIYLWVCVCVSVRAHVCV